jgi:type I restriction enzyme S subunit
MGSEWPKLRVGDVARSVSETHRLGKVSLIFLNTSDIYLGRVLQHDYSTVRDWPGQAKKSMEQGDILFSEILPANGRWAFIDFDARDYVVSTKLMVIRTTSNALIPKFLYYHLTSPPVTRWLQQLADSRSGTFPQITFDQVSDLEIPLPSADIQTIIVNFFDTLNARLGLLRQTNSTLESIAHGIFKSWFVDFDPVQAKAEGREPKGMDDATADLFPSNFVESKSGSLPNGFSSEELSTVVKITMGQSPPGTTYNEIGVGLPFYQGRADFSSMFPTRRVYCTAPTRLADPGDVLLSVRAPVGDLNISIDKCAIGRGLAAIRHKSDSTVFTWFLLKQLHKRFESFDTEGTVFGSVSGKDLKALMVIQPPPRLITAFAMLCGPAYERMKTNELSARTLTDLRDTLLPRLISGKLRVPEAEKIMGAAL